MRSKSSIGIFDSGFGGLSILKEIVKVLPQYDYVYLGDTARAPYGNRSQEIIYEFTCEGIEFLFQNGCDLVILACNTASSEALRKIQQEFLPKKYPEKKVLGVIIPGAEEAVLETKNKKIGVLATEATVSSGAFKREIQKIDKKINQVVSPSSLQAGEVLADDIGAGLLHKETAPPSLSHASHPRGRATRYSRLAIKVYEVPAPMLVPLVEAGEDKSKSAKILVEQYVKEVCAHGIDILILGCTHYGILEREIKKNAQGVSVLSEGKIVAKKLKEYFGRHAEIENKLSKKKNIKFYTTDSKERFDRLGSRFFGTKIISKRIDLN